MARIAQYAYELPDLVAPFADAILRGPQLIGELWDYARIQDETVRVLMLHDRADTERGVCSRLSDVRLKLFGK